MNVMLILMEQFKKFRKTAAFAIVILVAILGLAWFGLYKLSNSYAEVKNEGLDICNEWKERNATIMVNMFNGQGVLDVSSSGEAYMEMIDNGVVSVCAFTQTGYCIELSDGLPMTRSNHPADMMKTAIEMANSVKRMDAADVTGNEANRGKEAVLFKIEGVGNVTEYFREVSSLADATLYTFGVKPESNVTLMVSGFKGVNMEDENGNVKIENENVEGFGSLQMDLIVDGKAYLIYEMVTRATYDDGIYLGAEIYKRNINNEYTSEQSKEMAEAVMLSVKSTLEKR